MKCIKQFAYYGKPPFEGEALDKWNALDETEQQEIARDKWDKNNPNTMSPWSFYNKLVSGNIFVDIGTITQLGIQARPGTKFYLNYSPYPIVIGHTGIYELNLEGLGRINAIKFDAKSLEIFDDKDISDRLLIDIVYEGPGVVL